MEKERIKDSKELEEFVKNYVDDVQNGTDKKIKFDYKVTVRKFDGDGNLVQEEVAETSD